MGCGAWRKSCSKRGERERELWSTCVVGGGGGGGGGGGVGGVGGASTSCTEKKLQVK